MTTDTRPDLNELIDGDLYNPEKYAFTKEVKQKWLDAMASGEYSYGRGSLIERYTELADDGRTSVDAGIRGHCCLGVLAAVTGLLNEETGRTAEPDFNVGTADVISVRNTANEDTYYLYLPPYTQRELAAKSDGDEEWPIEMIKNLPTTD